MQIVQKIKADQRHTGKYILHFQIYEPKKL